MGAPLPDSAQVHQAIDIYLKTAYPAGPPLVVRSQIRVFDTWGGPLFKCPIFVALGEPPDTRYTLRLGNPHYPHMKLSVEPAPGQQCYFFRVDTHDRHICPEPSSLDYSSFCEMTEKNQKIATDIEAAWEQAGIPTFKSYLRHDIMRRKQATKN